MKVNIIHAFIDADWNVHVEAHWALIALAALVAFVMLWRAGVVGLVFRGSLEVDEVQLGIGKQVIKLKPNREDVRVAYKIWIELKTRKIGIPIDDRHDIVADLYASWYEFFKIARQLLKEIPAEKLRSNVDTRNLVNLCIRLLNNGLRPHLTEWQGKYRYWINYAEKQESDGTVTPQDLQRKFPQYTTLLEDMKQVNRRLVYFTGMLERIVYGQEVV